MKIIRFLDESGQVLFGKPEGEPFPPEKARLIVGGIFGDRRLLDEIRTIKKLLAPLQPPLVMAVGLNYKKHADETKIKHPERPVLFLKAGGSVIGHGQAILLPKAGPDEVDYEGELAIVIGRRGKNIPLARAREYILGYTCGNDVSARDWQIRLQKQQWARGKSFDTFCPLGPWIVTADEIPDPDSLRLRTVLNGMTVQDSNTGDMIFSVDELVSDLSQSLTLEPGTVILTGTPEGVGFTRQPPLFLRPGDRVEVEIERIGKLENPVELE